MTNQYLWDRITGSDANLRASDSDRERTADRLRESLAEGRLDTTEFQERLERCYDAKTVGELGELVTDLPRPAEHDDRRSFGSWRWRLAPLAPILIALIVVSAATGHDHHVVWFWIPLLLLIWRMSWGRRRRSWAGPRGGRDEWT